MLLQSSLPPSALRQALCHFGHICRVQGPVDPNVVCADYLTKVVVIGKQSTSTNVQEIMTPQSKLMTVSPQSSVVDVMALMTANNFRHVPVVRLLLVKSPMSQAHLRPCNEQCQVMCSASRCQKGTTSA